MAVAAIPLRPTRGRELRIAPEAGELSRARAFASAAAERFGLDESDRHDFTLAASEAVANAIEHGRPCGDGTIHVWVSLGACTLTLGVRDAGRFVADPPSNDPLRTRGRGLMMMSGLVDELALRRVEQYTQVELSKRRRFARA
jgi:anti-sigma regulatory factor (Ser/Thr protein kinase)